MIERSLCIIFLVAFIGFIGCRGEKGDTGPAGPQGNANIRTLQFTISTVQWNDVGAGLLYYDYTTSLLSPDIVDNGTVLLYLGLPGGGWASLPNAFADTSGNSYYINFAYANGFIEVIMSSADLTSLQLRFTKLFKLVTVDGTWTPGKKGRRNINIIDGTIHTGFLSRTGIRTVR